MGKTASRIGYLSFWLFLWITMPISLWVFIGVGLREATRDRVPERVEPAGEGSPAVAYAKV
jgi:hypothetical protein